MPIWRPTNGEVNVIREPCADGWENVSFLCKNGTSPGSGLPTFSVPVGDFNGTWGPDLTFDFSGTSSIISGVALVDDFGVNCWRSDISVVLASGAFTHLARGISSGARGIRLPVCAGPQQLQFILAVSGVAVLRARFFPGYGPRLAAAGLLS